MSIPEDIALFTSTIKNPALAEMVAKIWAVDRAHHEEHIANGGTFCPRCKCWLKPGHVCECKPEDTGAGTGRKPDAVPTLEKCELTDLIMKGLERNPCLTLKQVQRKYKNATWNDFATARSMLVERFRREAWMLMDQLKPAAPLPAKLRTLCERIVATSSGIAFANCGTYVIRKALKPKLAEAYFTNKACPWRDK